MFTNVFCSSRIFHYYLPTFAWCQKQLAAHRAPYLARGEVPPAFVVGISAPQGCGKTTLVGQLQEMFTADGCTAASVSIDDYYLTVEPCPRHLDPRSGQPLTPELVRLHAGSRAGRAGGEAPGKRATALPRQRGHARPAAGAHQPRYVPALSRSRLHSDRHFLSLPLRPLPPGRRSAEELHVRARL